MIIIGMIGKAFDIKKSDSININNNEYILIEDYKIFINQNYLEKPPKFRCFSHQSATVGLSIVNHAYYVHDRTLHCGARRSVNFEVMVFED